MMDDYAAAYDLGSRHWPVSTTSDEAQLWFDRGVAWTFGFNHTEAIACYRRAVEADPDLAMAYWGIAYASGPNYNMPWWRFDPKGRADALAQAYDAAREALARSEGATPLELRLIEALQARYPQRDPVEDMKPWDAAFAEAMRAVHLAFPESLDARSVFVESLMQITPWQMWDLALGRPAEGAHTEEARAILETAMETLPGAMSHAGILHLYVHLMEMSPFPEKALNAADILRTLMPGAGHLVHMATHIDVLCGHYRDVVHWNHTAAMADMEYYRREGPFNIYSGYRIHNYHFEIYGAMFLGQLQPAREALRAIEATVPEDMLRMETPPMANFFESYMAFEPHVLVRFGLWEEAVAMPLPDDQELYCTKTAMIHYAKTVALAALGRVAEAEAQEKVFLDACARVPETRLQHNNTVVSLLEVAKEMARGEILYRKGEYEAAFAHLRQAVETEDALPYDEPWGWMQPSRHALGALLYEQGQVEEAEAVYRADLGLGGHLRRATVHPDNIWSLKGLHDCLKARGDTVEILQIRQRLDLAAARADRAVAASCFCAQAAMQAAE